ncbi:helix-turn-helix transcriptional regulator [Nocardia sp. 2]|uniref:Helix-turn-helix transcriptional regulator n=1 Tax=Nocardia acididurans TaxID=2802282 RepID=A0ABS1LYZ9_9NOCA|nr:helix-turn-helix transcriptional regulator [Nocardia acididurans]MBL1073441.1 helix-turn-helix transcriptional regulator [Nocardia acididurans]
MDDMGVGARIGRARRLARLTQVQLAQKANVSLSLLRKVEQGDRPATPALTAAVARVLGVSVGDLNGQPYEPEPSDGAAHATIPELRRAIVAYDDEPPTGPATFDDLTAALDRVREGMRRARYSDMTVELPDLIRGLHQLADSEAPGRHLEEIHSSLAYAYSKAMLFAYQYGYLDLAGMAAERCGWAASRSGDPLWPITAEYNRALILLYSGAYVGGLRTIDRAYAASEQLPTTPDLLAVRGALHLRGSILSARALDSGTAEAHIAEARGVAEAIRDSRYRNYGTGFRPSNVDIHSVAVPVELSDGTTALSRAEHIRLAESVAPSRAGHYYLDVSRAWLLHGNKDRAFQTLEQARKVAPEMIRNHPQVHETLRVLAHTRRGTDKLAHFAKWANVKI